MGRSMPLAQARRIALEAQGLAKGRPTRQVQRGAVLSTVCRLQVLQIDSVNVLTRAHYVPIVARLGMYDRALLDSLSHTSPRRVAEYWAHEASIINPELFPALRAWQRRTWMGASRIDPDLRQILEARILEALSGESDGVTARTLQQRLGLESVRDAGDWGWNWGVPKRILEGLFAEGRISSAGRTGQFERLYCAPEQVYGTSAAAHEPMEPRDALLVLAERAAAALGVGTAYCIADYFRTPVRDTAWAIDVLVARGVLTAVRIDNWRSPAYLHCAAVTPRTARSRALLSPFDSLIFARPRVEQLFGFRYRIGIYTPTSQRKYGYYVLPFLLDDALVARVDLKADRAGKRLIVKSSHAEPQAPPGTATALAAELWLMCRWLGLEDVSVEPSGNLASRLAPALSASG